MIEILKNFPDNVIALSCEGQVTKEDYDGILVPAILKALKRHDKIRLLYKTSANFTGYDPGALWEDLKIGVEHPTRWERVAVVTDVDWIVQMMTYLQLSNALPGEVVSAFGEGRRRMPGLPPPIERVRGATSRVS